MDFDHLQLRIWAGKGNKHRIATVAQELLPDLQHQIRRVKLLLEQELTSSGYSGIWLPNVLARKFPSASRKLGWHYLFPSTSLSCEPGTNNVRRHHVDESSINKLIKRAAAEARITKDVTSHTLRHYVPFLTMSGNERILRAGSQITGHLLQNALQVVDIIFRLKPIQKSQ